MKKKLIKKATNGHVVKNGSSKLSGDKAFSAAEKSTLISSTSIVKCLNLWLNASVKYLDQEVIIKMHDVILNETGGRPGILHPDRLASLEVMPKQEIFGQELYPSLFHKAAVYVREINQGHIFNDGNKRTSLVTLAEFLRINDYDITHVVSNSLEDFALAVAKGLTFEEIIAWIIKHAKPLHEK